MCDHLLFPFSSLSNSQLVDNFNDACHNNNSIDLDLKKLLTDALTDDVINTLEAKYYTPCQLNDLANRYKDNTKLSMFHVNIRSLNCNHNNLITFLQCLSFRFDIIILSEIWSTNVTHYSNMLRNYDCFLDVPTKRAGGVAIFVKSSLNAVQTNKYNAPLFVSKACFYESVWIEVCVDKNNYVVGGYYRHPNTSIKDFTDDFSFTLDKLKKVKHCYIFGDMNISLANYSHHSITKTFIDAVLDCKFLPYVYLPTRITDSSSSIIDHVYSNDIFTGVYMCKTGLIINAIADHFANFIFIVGVNQCVSDQIITVDPVRNFSKSNVEKFNICLDSIDWSNVYQCSDPNIAFNYFIDRLAPIHDSCFPFNKPKRNMNHDKKWVTSALIKSMNVKCKLHKKWVKSRKKYDEIKYKNYSKMLRKLLRVAERQYYDKLFDSKTQSIKNIWKNVSLLVNNRNGRHYIASKIIKDGTVVTDSYDMANEFNNYFAEVSDRLNKNFQNKVNTNHTIYLGLPQRNSFFCSSVTLTELLLTVNNLKQSRNCVGNFMSSSLLRDCIDHIALPLLYIYNLSFDAGIFPEQLKISKVVPVFKKGCKTEMSNYRPISLTNPLGKVLEKLMHVRMSSYLERYKVLYDYQFGFRKNYSTSLALIDVVNMIQNEIYEDKFVLGVFMDLQKAFDTINLDILLSKLSHYGFRGVCLNWFRSYLVGRTQFTVINGVNSPMISTNSGIPQGTVLGPLLFILYINDITNSVTKSKIKLFADDSNLFVISDSLKALFYTAESELSSISDWICANKLFVNYEKTNFMVFVPPRLIGGSHNLLIPSVLLFNDHVINLVHSVKYLGIMIDDKLSWSDHINYLINKISSLTGILYRNKHYLPLSCKKNIYFALIYSVITFCIEVFANVNKVSLAPLIIKCNRLLRMLQNKPRRTSLYELYFSFNTLPIDLLFNFYTAKFMHRCLYNTSSVPSIVSNWFPRGIDLHSHNTRHKNNFCIQSNCNPKSILYYGPIMWAKLPVELQRDPSLSSFLKAYKGQLLNSMKH